jgi:hypothetical protein
MFEKPEPASPDMFPIETALRETFDENLTKLGDRTGLDLAAQATERREYAAVMRATGLHEHAGLAKLIHNEWTNARMADAGPVDDVDLDAQIDVQNEASRSALRGQWGAEGAEDLLQRAQKFARQHPKLAAILQTRGIGSRPHVVQALVEHVRKVNFR